MSGQELVSELAADICACMEAAPEIVYPRMQARRCVDKVLEAHPRSIRAALDLSIDLPADRAKLVELFIEPLHADCDMLRELKPGEVEPKLRYSDFDLLKTTVAFTKPDAPPPPDDATSTLKEISDRFVLPATVVERPGRDRLWVTMEGETYKFTLPRRLRNRDFRPGEPLQLVCRRLWHTTITYELVDIQE